eukprot:TRINITY_DN13549_c0_g1_i1.p1 TRINITY_DN13549_c0_g1~~TRINITY_DN13549_c0_g1_i1.p1  ORF type:complete len:321 (+),score=48.99 TRINITY_DN13549_c0_g1_i1:80-964(+)
MALAAERLLQRAGALDTFPKRPTSSAAAKGRGEGLLLYVRTTTGETHAVEVSADGTVANVLEELEQSGVLRGSGNGVRLSLSGRQLDPADLLADVGACAQAVLDVLPEPWKWDPFTAEHRGLEGPLGPGPAYEVDSAQPWVCRKVRSSSYITPIATRGTLPLGQPSSCAIRVAGIRDALGDMDFGVCPSSTVHPPTGGWLRSGQRGCVGSLSAADTRRWQEAGGDKDGVLFVHMRLLPPAADDDDDRHRLFFTMTTSSGQVMKDVKSNRLQGGVDAGWHWAIAFRHTGLTATFI